MSFLRHLRRFSTLLRQNFSSECEKALNKQINMELKACHDYLAMSFHFDRSDVALPGLHEFFRQASLEERQHAEMLMKYVNKRGGQICLEAIPAPSKNHWSSILEAMTDALNMEKAVNASLLELNEIAENSKDPNLCDFIASNFLQEQVDAQKQLADYITQIERCEDQLGSYIFDLNFMKKGNGHGSNGGGGETKHH